MCHGRAASPEFSVLGLIGSSMRRRGQGNEMGCVGHAGAVPKRTNLLRSSTRCDATSCSSVPASMRCSPSSSNATRMMPLTAAVAKPGRCPSSSPNSPGCRTGTVPAGHL